MLGSIFSSRIKKGFESLEGSLRSAFLKLEPESPVQKQERERTALHERIMESLHKEFEAVQGLEKDFSALRHQLADDKSSITVKSANEPFIQRPKNLKPEFEKLGAFVEGAWGTNNVLRFGPQGFEVVEREKMLGRELEFTARVRPMGFNDFVSFGLTAAEIRTTLEGYGKSKAEPAAAALEPQAEAVEI